MTEDIDKALKIPGLGDKLRTMRFRAAGKARGRAQQAAGNLFDKPAERMSSVRGYGTGTHFGKPTADYVDNDSDRRWHNASVIIPGVTAGGVVGLAASAPGADKRYKQKQENLKTIRQNNAKIKQLSKSVHLITDVGTGAERAEQRAMGTRKVLKPLGAYTLGAAGGLGIVGASEIHQRKKHNALMARQQTRIANQNKRIATLSKADRRHERSGGAIEGAGGVTAATGLAAGGIPGSHPSYASINRFKPGSGAGVVRRTPATLKSLSGGILGFRVSDHKGTNEEFRERVRRDQRGGKPKNATEAFEHARHAAKIKPEEDVIRGMSRGRLVANGALLSGGAATLYGAHRGHRVSKSKTDRRNATILGAGGAGAAIGHVAPKFLDSKSRNYAASASRKIDEAQKIVPATGGRKGDSMYPRVEDYKIKQDPKYLRGASHEAAAKVGALRGAAGQERHFAEVLGDTSKVVRRFRTPSAVAAGFGAGGLVATRHKKEIGKSAFGVDHVVEKSQMTQAFNSKYPKTGDRIGFLYDTASMYRPKNYKAINAPYAAQDAARKARNAAARKAKVGQMTGRLTKIGHVK